MRAAGCGGSAGPGRAGAAGGPGAGLAGLLRAVRGQCRAACRAPLLCAVPYPPLAYWNAFLLCFSSFFFLPLAFRQRCLASKRLLTRAEVVTSKALCPQVPP